MKGNKEKTEAEKEIDRLKKKPLSDDLKAEIRKKEAYINRPINK